MRRSGIIESTLVGLTRALGHALVSEQVARQRGILQVLDPRVRVAGLLVLVLAVTLSRRITVILALFCAAVLLALLSKVSVGTLTTRGGYRKQIVIPAPGHLDAYSVTEPESP